MVIKLLGDIGNIKSFKEHEPDCRECLSLLQFQNTTLHSTMSHVCVLFSIDTSVSDQLTPSRLYTPWSLHWHCWTQISPPLLQQSGQHSPGVLVLLSCLSWSHGTNFGLCPNLAIVHNPPITHHWFYLECMKALPWTDGPRLRESSWMMVSWMFGHAYLDLGLPMALMNEEALMDLMDG